MQNRDKRSLLLMLVIGDGNLHIRKGEKQHGVLSIGHGLQQGDYLNWKARLMSTITGRQVNVRAGHKGKTLQVQLRAKKFRVWKQFCYPNNKKHIGTILKYIRHPEMALAVWLMDDGYSEFRQKRGQKIPSAALRIYTCDSGMDDHWEIIKWFNVHFDVSPQIRFQRNNRTGKVYPFLRFGSEDSMKLWTIVRKFILTFKSMQHKFRYIETRFQLLSLHTLPSSQKEPKDIVQVTT